MQDFMSHKNRPMSFYSLPIIFIFSNQHCAINWWSLHVDKCCHCQLHSNWFGFTDYSFSWNCCDNCNSNEGWSLLRLVLDKHGSHFCCRGFWMFTPKQVHEFLHQCANMAWEQVHEFFYQCVNMAWGSKGNGGPPSILCAFIGKRC